VEDVKTKAFVRDIFQILKVQVVRKKPELAVPLCGGSGHDPGSNKRVRQPPAGEASPSIFRGTLCPAKHNISCIRELSKMPLVRDFKI
jgi:hypothetical protein